jgi:glycosyltransferase involved in cell wall biosynthesis
MSRNLYDALPAAARTARTWIVPDGVDFSRFRPLDRARCREQLGWDPARAHVLFPALRSRPEKRYALAEAGVELLSAEGPAVQLHALENVPHGDVPIWLNAANAVVLTSAHEGSTNVVKEALACDVAVVSVDVGDAQERLSGIEGCFIADATPQGIAAQLSAALAHGERVDGRASVRDLALDRTAARVAELYRVVSGRDGRPPAQAGA